MMRGLLSIMLQYQYSCNYLCAMWYLQTKRYFKLMVAEGTNCDVCITYHGVKTENRLQLKLPLHSCRHCYKFWCGSSALKFSDIHIVLRASGDFDYLSWDGNFQSPSMTQADSGFHSSCSQLNSALQISFAHMRYKYSKSDQI